jgi:hypothetical protein
MSGHNKKRKAEASSDLDEMDRALYGTFRTAVGCRTFKPVFNVDTACSHHPKLKYDNSQPCLQVLLSI